MLLVLEIKLASGADNSLWLFGAGVLTTSAIFIASLWRGAGGGSKLDLFSLAVSVLGMILWLTFSSLLISILANIVVAIVALLPTFKKARKMPESETRIAWLAGAVSALLAAISVGKLDLQLLLLPIVSTLLQGHMVYLLYARPLRSKYSKESASRSS